MEKTTFKSEPHSPEKINGISWLVCKRCGLVWLRNEFTGWCIKNGCDNAEHPDYKKMSEKLWIKI